MNKELYEKQVSIEHVKLSIAYFVCMVCESAFAFFTLMTPMVIRFLASWAGEDLKMKIIGTIISFLYLTVNSGLTVLFISLAFDSKDDYIIAGRAKDGDVIWKYTSEILAERKLKSRGIIIEQSTEHGKS